MPQPNQITKIFIGCDVSKAEIVTSILSQAQQRPLASMTFDNTKAGIKKLIKEAAKHGPVALCVCEPTGGYEALLLDTLAQHNWPLHRADTRKAAAFAQSITLAKTDALDAHALALYGRE